MSAELGLLARICTQIERLRGRLDEDTLYLWRRAVGHRTASSPDALGCLLALVREAWVGWIVCTSEGGSWGARVRLVDAHGIAHRIFTDATLGPCLVSALEAAP